MASRYPKFIAVLLVLLLACSVSVVFADVETEEDFDLDFEYGESFAFQDVTNNVVITFTVASGNLTGTASLNANSLEGTLIITPTSNGVITLSTDNPAQVTIYIQDAVITTYTFSSGTQFIIRWSYHETYVPPVVGSSNTTFYFRSDTFKTNNITGYGLHTDNTNSYVTKSDIGTGDVTVYYGFRVWKLDLRSDLTELTDGSPVAVMSRAAAGSGYQSGNWTYPTTTNLQINFDALKVIVYMKFGAGDWQAEATFVTKTLLEKQIQPSTWTFTLYTIRAASTDTTGSFVYGSSSRNSGITGISFKHPTPQEIALALGLGGDWVSMILYPFLYILGNLFYGLAMLFAAGTYYFRYKRWEVPLILIILFGSTSAFGLLIPSPAFRLLYIIVLFVIAVLLYRVFH